MWNRRGFSLIELVVVLVILSVLSSVSVVSYKGYRERSMNQLDKKQLSSFVVMADVFKAVNQFYLPNMKAMNIMMKGRYHSNYKLLCHRENIMTRGDILFKTNNTETSPDITSNNYCGKLTFKATADKTLDVGDQCKTGTSAHGWAGYVFCHYYSTGNPSPWTDTPSGWLPSELTIGNIFTVNYSPVEPLGSILAERYANLAAPYRQSGFQFKPADDDDWDVLIGNPEKINKTFYQYFKIADVNSECKRVSRSDKCPESEPCCINKETGVDPAQVQSALGALPDWSVEADRQEFLSGPNKLVFIALACKKTNLAECVSGEATRVIRMGTDKIIKVY